jgi:hypothetical protein
MITSELLETIRAAWISDEPMNTWCLANFEKRPTVRIGVDDENPPDPATEYPIVAVTDIRQVRGDAVREISWEFEFGVGVVQSDISEDSRGKTMTGFVQAEQLRELAENALYRARIADVSSNSTTGSFSRYPLFISGSIIPIKTLKTNRRGLPG